ncbi:hypothetical protein Tco_1453143 [Tanacetum coccineum]
MSCPMDDANVEANLRGPVGLSKWATIFVIIGLSLASPKIAPSLTRDVVVNLALQKSIALWEFSTKACFLIR